MAQDYAKRGFRVCIESKATLIIAIAAHQLDGRAHRMKPSACTDVQVTQQTPIHPTFDDPPSRMTSVSCQCAHRWICYQAAYSIYTIATNLGPSWLVHLGMP
jgi:hypothetical protein